MKILESPLLGAFIAYMMANWSRRSRVDQSRRRLRHLVAMVRAVADKAEADAAAEATPVRDEAFSTWLHLLRNEALRGQEVLDATGNAAAAAVAGSARRFLSELRGLFGRSDEMDRLAEAVEELDRLAEPGGALDRLSNVFGRRFAARATAMDVDGGPPVAGPRHRAEASGSAESADEGAGLPAPGAKRKRACSSCVDPGSTSHGGVDAGERQKRRLPAGSRGRFLTAPREPSPQSPERARTVALAMAKVRRCIGKPTRQRRQAILGRHFSRFSLQ